MLSPNTIAQASLPMNSSPKIKACANPSGDGWIIYSKLTPNCFPSFNNLIKFGWSSLVVIIKISFSLWTIISINSYYKFWMILIDRIIKQAVLRKY